MTDRIDRLTVVLSQDTRDDDVEAITNAIRMIVGVEAVELNVVDSKDYAARVKARSVVVDKLFDLIKEL